MEKKASVGRTGLEPVTPWLKVRMLFDLHQRLVPKLISDKTTLIFQPNQGINFPPTYLLNTCLHYNILVQQTSISIRSSEYVQLNW